MVEILITVVLLGLSIGATLTLLATTIQATATTRDHANAHAWLQTAADVLYARDPEACTDMTTMASGYETTIQTTENPEDWPASNITVVDMQVYRHIVLTDGTQDIGWGTVCAAVTDPLQVKAELHRLTLEVRAESGEVLEQVEVILSDD